MIYLSTNHLKAVLTHAAKDDVRYYLNGILFEVCKDGSVHLVATDGHRMFAGIVLKPSWLDTPQQGPFSLIIPRVAVETAIKMAKRNHGIWLASTPDGRYRLDDVGFVPVDGKFPDWRRVRPNQTTAKPENGSQFDWQYLADANSALRLWYGSKNGNYALATYETGIGLMTGSDCSASITIMGIRTNTVDGVAITHFAPSAYE